MKFILNDNCLFYLIMSVKVFEEPSTTTRQTKHPVVPDLKIHATTLTMVAYTAVLQQALIGQ